MTDKPKPCSLDYCPLVDEHRFFVEAQTLLRGQPDFYVLLGVTGKHWCKQQVANGLYVDMRVCRSVLEQAAENYRAASSGKGMAHFIISLKRALAEREKSLSRPIDGMDIFDTGVSF